MSGPDPLLLRGALLDGRLVDCRLADGVVAELAPRLEPHPGEPVLEAGGGALLPGLHDHHVHVLAAAAARASLDLRGGPLPAADASLGGPAAADDGGWLRVVGLGDDDATRADLDAVWPGRPVRAQHRSGALWVLSSAAIEELGDHLTEEERRTGRVWRERGRWEGALAALDLTAQLTEVGTAYARWGVTGLTDATPDLEPSALATVRAAVPQRVCSLGPGVRALPRKVLVTDHDDDAWPRLRAGVAAARAEGRPVALHAVSATALALVLAVLDEVGVVPGDRVEHAAVCDDRTADRLAELGLVVVTQPSVAARRGAAMLEEAEPAERPWLWRVRGLVERGVPVVLSSDAPYGDPDPWTTIRLAASAGPGPGSPWLGDESIDPGVALRSYLTSPADPAGAVRRVEPGAPADLCLLDSPLSEVLDRVVAGATESPVRATFVGGARVDQ
ncbi:amidohydrolase family protein [Nocardioides sp. SYSU DS0651]|uniref:amidohydrolase family protein n=1 Tax=Nocardioides sp. SYSU DS0651 TaxID=3415955 RepID=UPI003F4B5569